MGPAKMPHCKSMKRRHVPQLLNCPSTLERAEAPMPSLWSHPGPAGGGWASSTLSRTHTFWDGHDAEELEV